LKQRKSNKAGEGHTSPNLINYAVKYFTCEKSCYKLTMELINKLLKEAKEIKKPALLIIEFQKKFILHCFIEERP
jgi:hypothetical protein